MEKKIVNNIDHPNTPITLKINIPDKGIFEKRFTFNSEDNVWAAKNQVIHEIGQELKDIQNYGFFVPPHQGKAGKFMDEGRPLSEYSILENDQILEFMLKRRIYRSISFDESKLTKIHTKTYLKKLIELVEQNNAGQVNQLLEKGLDPNFLDPKTGETPLTVAAVKKNANEVIMFLINGGAYFDFKNRNGLTAVHRAAIAGNSHNIKAFLDLGASPNYRDLKGLTPLYHACLSGKNPNVAELLLGDQAEIGVVDSQGWQEIHQVCRYGHVQHLEQLIYYGATINAQNGSGNTPLHICSLYNQEDCARILLHRGARRDIVNFANQTAEMVAIVATNAALSTFIRDYKESDVVPHIDKPTYSTRRRNQSKSRPTANSVFLRDSTDTFIFCSESLSTTSSTPSIHSETSEPMSLDLSPRDIVPQVNVTVVEESPSRKPRRRRTLSGSGSDSSYATDSGDEAGSNLTTPVASLSPDELTMRWRTYSLSSLNKEEKGNIPRVKEVKGAANMGPNPGKSNMRKTYVAVTNFTPTQAGELSLAEGDLVEVITKGEKGYWQGSVAGKIGWFPADCVEDLKKRKNNKSKNSLHKPVSIASSLNKSNTSLDQPYIPPVPITPQPRQVILHKVKAGFGFQMRGANVPAVNKLEFRPSAKIPALQYVGDVEPGGEAERRGVKKGDYILEVNGNDVKTASHRHVVSLIRKTGQTLVMKLISVDNGEHFSKAVNNVAKPAPSGSPPANQPPPSEFLPPSMPAPAVPTSGNFPPTNVIVNGTGHVDSGHVDADKKPPPIPSRAPTTSLSSKSKANRVSVTDVDFEKTPAVQEDRIISIPRERIPSNEQQWHSPLTGYSSLPRRPKSSYGAIIASPHASPSDEAPSRNFRPVVYNTGFTTLPSKSGNTTGNTHRVSQDDTAVVRRKQGSARIARDRPKSWMPKVLPTEPPPVSPPIPREQPPPKQSEDFKAISRSDSKNRKKRFSFRKKKEKDYMATSAAPEPEDEPDNNEKEANSNDAPENLHIEGEENRPNSLPGINKRLSTFKPVNIPHRQFVPTDAVSPELSQALQKRKSQGVSSSTDDGLSPVFSPGHEGQVPVFPPPPSQAPPQPPKAKSLEDSIKEEMMRRRCNTAPASAIPSKPRRTFEYRKSTDEPSPEGEEVPDEKGGLDSELAKAVARRAAKMTTAPKTDTHIYENVINLNINASREPRSSVEEPPTLSIEEKMKKLHLQGEVILPTKFKPPVAPPQGKSAKAKPPLEAPAEKTSPSEKVSPSDVSAPEKLPPKVLPKPKKKSPSTASESGSDDVMVTSRPTTLPILANTTSLPPPLLSPEMVATQLLDDVINDEVKRSNWDTASWKDKDFSSGRSSPTSVDSTATTNTETVEKSPTAPVASTPPSGKKKYVYKITLVTEKQADGSADTQTMTQVIAKETSPPQLLSPGGSELPPAQPPPGFLDESSMPAPVFTPPTSPGADISNEQDFIPPPPLSFSPPPSPIVAEDFPPPPLSATEEVCPSPQVPPPVAFQEDSPTKPHPPTETEQPKPRVEQLPPPLSATEEVSPSPQVPPPVAFQEDPPTKLDPATETEQPESEVEQLPPPPHQDLTQQTTSLPQPDSEENKYLAQLPAPIVAPHDETSLPQEKSATPAPLVPPEEFKENTPSPPSPKDIVVPPPIFADSTDGHPEPKEGETFEKHEVALNEKTEGVESETVTTDNSETSSTKDEELAKQRMEEGNEKANIEDSPVEMPSEEKTEPHGGEEESVVQVNQSLEPEETQSQEKRAEPDEAKEAISAVNENISQEVSGKEVQAPPESKDQNENVVEVSTAHAENKKELAPSKTAVADVSTESLSFRETPYEDWSCVDVCDWLASIGMAEHSELFQENDIRGTNLLGLTKEDLRELGVKKLGHRMTITNEVNRLTTNNGAATNL